MTTATLIEEFDVWRQGYGGATVVIYKAGTTELAEVWYDRGATQPGANPVDLLEFNTPDTSFGKFPRSLYTLHPYEVRVTDTGESTGVLDAPNTDMAGRDLGAGVVTPTGGTVPRSLADALGDHIWAEAFGEIGTDPQANTAIILAAIGAASARGGATVYLPYGTIPFLKIDIPEGVTVMGGGKTSTVLQSQSGEAVVTLSGNYSGLSDLTLDGVQLIPNSIGIKAVSRTRTMLRDVLVKRFNRNVEFRGGTWFTWENVDVMDGTDGVILMGDDNSGGTVPGSALEHFTWKGGELGQHANIALQAIYEDFPIRHISLEDVKVKDNTETAVDLAGAQFVRFTDCEFSGNTRWLVMRDDDLDTIVARRDNTTSTVTFEGCDIVDGEATFDGECETVLFDQCEIRETEIKLNTPQNSITVRDCVEREVTLSGVTTAWCRWVTAQNNIVVGRTVDDSPLTAWRQRLDFGEVGLFVATVLGVGQNIEQTLHAVRRGMYKRAGLDLPYAGQTSNFTLGNKVIGGISGASGTIQADSDSGATGTLTLINVEGDFIDDEPLTEESGSGNGFVNLPVTEPAVTAATSDVVVQAIVGAGGTIAFGVSGEHVVLIITGNAGETMNWTVRVDGVVSRA